MNTVRFNSDILSPSKVICIGRNYVEHVKELNNEVPTSMLLFNKANSSITNKIYYFNQDCHFEAEISFLIRENRYCGVGIGLDLTKRKLQSFLKEKGFPWERAKSFDKSAVFSDFVSVPTNIESLNFELYINRVLVQHGGYELMIHKPEDILNEIQSFMTVFDGDIVMTGTPKGVGNYNIGDVFIGRLYSNSSLLIETSWIVE